MSIDVVDLREFYISPLGHFVRKLLRRKLADIWPDLRDETILALGYGTPLLRPWLENAKALFAMMPAAQGVAYWPREGPNISCLADLADLPLPDNSIDRVVLLHAIEGAAAPEAVLNEVWRVLKPGGRALLLVPNRRGLWAHLDKTPFGFGQPYSTSQLKKLLKNQCFFAERSWHALFAPPAHSSFGLALARVIERCGPYLFPAFGGLLIMEASKQIYAPLGVQKRRMKSRLLFPLPFPQAPVPTN